MSAAIELLATADAVTRTRADLDLAYVDFESHFDALDTSRMRLNVARQAFIEALKAYEKSTAILPAVSEERQ